VIPSVDDSKEVGKRPTAAEVPILDGNGHDTPGRDSLEIEKIVQNRFLSRAVNGRTVSTLSLLGQDLGIPILRVHEKILRSQFYPQGRMGNSRCRVWSPAVPVSTARCIKRRC
jgi:hypothetical protein